MLVFVVFVVAFVEVDVSLAAALKPSSINTSKNLWERDGIERKEKRETHADMIITIQTLPHRAVGNDYIVVNYARSRGADVW
jgi:hypothetical protein